MDTNDVRIILMLLGLALFIGIWVWAWSSRRRKGFDEAANLPFLDDQAKRAADSAAKEKKQ